MSGSDVFAQAPRKPALVLDFDGVIHSYHDGWRDGSIYGEVLPGFFEWEAEAEKLFSLSVFSSRSDTIEGRLQMHAWLTAKHLEWMIAKGDREAAAPLQIAFAKKKPPAFLSIDDRALTFQGEWRDPVMAPDNLINFRPWNAR